MQTSDHEHQIETSGHEIRYLLNYSRFSDLRILNVGGVGGGGGGVLARFTDQKIANHESRKSKGHFSFWFTIINKWSAVFYLVLSQIKNWQKSVWQNSIAVEMKRKTANSNLE